MHSAFLWCSCHYEDCIGDLARIVKPHVPPQHLSEFFWRHLEQDIKHLSIATGRSIDDAILLVHLVLKEMLTKEPPAGYTMHQCIACTTKMILSRKIVRNYYR